MYTRGISYLLSVVLLLVLSAPSVHGQVLSSPSLQFPDDGDTTTTRLPVFSWQAASGSKSIRYEFRLVEVYLGQTGAQAMLSNTLYYFSSGILSPMLAYPASGAPLSPVHTYAWQVWAFGDEGYQPVPSEVFIFTLAEQLPEPIVEPEKMDFIVLDAARPEGHLYHLPANILPLQVSNPYYGQPYSIRVLDHRGQEVYTKQELLKEGTLQFVLKFSYVKKKVHTVQVTDPSGKQYSASFISK